MSYNILPLPSTEMKKLLPNLCPGLINAEACGKQFAADILGAASFSATSAAWVATLCNRLGGGGAALLDTTQAVEKMLSTDGKVLDCTVTGGTTANCVKTTSCTSGVEIPTNIKLPALMSIYWDLLTPGGAISATDVCAGDTGTGHKYGVQTYFIPDVTATNAADANTCSVSGSGTACCVGFYRKFDSVSAYDNTHTKWVLVTKGGTDTGGAIKAADCGGLKGSANYYPQDAATSFPDATMKCDVTANGLLGKVCDTGFDMTTC